MRVRHTVSVLVAVCSLGGVALTLGIAHRLNEVERESREVGASPIALSEWARLADASAQWLSTADIVLGSGQDLFAEDAVRLAAHVEALALQITDSELAATSREDLSSFRDIVWRGKQLVSGASKLVAPDRDKGLYDLLSQFDDIVAPLPELIARVEGRLTAEADRRRQNLEAMRLELIWIAGAALAGYLACVVGVWIWVSVTVTSPLAALTKAAACAERDGGRLEFTETGPIEVRELADSVASFTGRLETANEVMESTIAERTAELLKSNRVKDEFLATISHEIRTPTNGVLGVLDVLGRTPLNDEQRNWLKVAKSSGRSLERIINDILDLSSIEAGRIKLMLGEFDLRALADEQVTLLMLQLVDKDVEVALVIDPQFPKLVEGDEERFRQLLRNLLGNAAKFTPQGSILLVLDGEPTNGGSWTVEARVEDTGVGINEDRLADIFEPFMQSDGSSTRAFGGAGLGLTLAKRIVESMGGAIGVSSEIEKGSTFWFTIDVGNVDGGRAQSSGDVPVPLGLRALVVEDNPVNQLVLTAILESLGCEALCVEDGSIAVETIKQQTFDVVLMDCHMPRMDGFEATKQMLEYGVEAPIIGVSAGVFDRERERCLAVGMVDFCNKPVRIDVLRTAIAAAVGVPT